MNTDFFRFAIFTLFRECKTPIRSGFPLRYNLQKSAQYPETHQTVHSAMKEELMEDLPGIFYF